MSAHVMARLSNGLVVHSWHEDVDEAARQAQAHVARNRPTAVEYDSELPPAWRLRVPYDWQRDGE